MTEHAGKKKKWRLLAVCEKLIASQDNRKPTAQAQFTYLVKNVGLLDALPSIQSGASASASHVPFFRPDAPAK